MRLPLQDWWTEGQDRAAAIYPAPLLVPLVVISVVEAGLYLALPGANKAPLFFFASWAVFAIPFAIRRRRAAILTKDALIFRPVFGRSLNIPFAGIKRASLVPWYPGQLRTPIVRIEFLVGSQIELRMGVIKVQEIVQRLQAAASARE